MHNKNLLELNESEMPNIAQTLKQLNAEGAFTSVVLEASKYGVDWEHMWNEATDSIFMLRLAEECGVPRKALMLAACDCAEQAVQRYWHLPDDEGPMLAIFVTRESYKEKPAYFDMSVMTACADAYKATTNATGAAADAGWAAAHLFHFPAQTSVFYAIRAAGHAALTGRMGAFARQDSVAVAAYHDAMATTSREQTALIRAQISYATLVPFLTKTIHDRRVTY